MKEFLSLWQFGEVWGIFPGYVGKIIEYLPIHEFMVVLHDIPIPSMYGILCLITYMK